MLPNLANTVLRFAQSITIRVATQTVINYAPSVTYADSTIKATVTTPTSEDLTSLEIDTSLKYKTIHTTYTTLKIGDLFVHQNITYKIIVFTNNQDYGYTEALGEEVQL